MSTRKTAGKKPASGIARNPFNAPGRVLYQDKNGVWKKFPIKNPAPNKSTPMYRNLDGTPAPRNNDGTFKKRPAAQKADNYSFKFAVGGKALSKQAKAFNKKRTFIEVDNVFVSPFKIADPVKSPAHYTDGKIEVWEYIEDKKLGFHLGNVVKYVSRAGKKDPTKTVEDLEKAMAYLSRKIQLLKDGQSL